MTPELLYRVKESAGFTLVEFMVTIAMMTLLLGAVIPLLISSINTSGRQSDRVTALDDDRIAFDNISRELRAANCVAAGVAGRSVTVSQPASNGNCAGGTATVSINCGAPSSTAGQFKCVRTVLTTGSAKTLIDQVTNTDPLTVTAASASGGRPTVRIKLQKSPEASGTPVLLHGTVSPRVVGT